MPAAGHTSGSVFTALRQYLEQEWVRRVNERKHQHGKHHEQHAHAEASEQMMPLKFDNKVSDVLAVWQLLPAAGLLPWFAGSDGQQGLVIRRWLWI